MEKRILYMLVLEYCQGEGGFGNLFPFKGYKEEERGGRDTIKT